MSGTRTTNISEKFLLTFDEAASYFSIGKDTLRNMASYGELPDRVLHSRKRLN